MDHREDMEIEREDTQTQQERPMRRSEQQSNSEGIGQTMRVIEMLEHKLSDAYRIPMKRNKGVVDTSEMMDLLGQLRIVLPKAVTQAQNVLLSSQQMIDNARAKADQTADEADRIYNETVTKARQFKEDIVSEADAYEKSTRLKAQEEAQMIIADAQTRAEQLIFAAQQQAQALVDDNEITRRAQAYAMETRERAEKDADSIYNQACVHADKMLSGAAAALNRSAGELAQMRDSLLGQGQPMENR
ncbi:MAG: hypothetical protein IJ381_01720 [Clostridia bacterium]|nr:hypothetical protein [Clostridia bacterium]